MVKHKTGKNRKLDIHAITYMRLKKTELINWYRAACFSPTKSTWIVTIKRYFFKTWSNLTVKNMKLYLTKPIATNLGSTKKQDK